MNCNKVYEGVKKSVVNDYPFEIDWDDDKLYSIFSSCYDKVVTDHSHINNSYYSDNNGGGIVNITYLDHYIVLCYRFAHALIQEKIVSIADAVYYSMRIRGQIDCFYKSEIGDSFMPVHPLGTIMDSHAKYGKFFKIYDGCHIGPYQIIGKLPSEWEHPEFGDYVTMLAHSKVYGKSKIGNNVIISIGTVIINEEIPDNCIVSGVSPNLYCQKLKVSNKEIEK